MVLSVRITEEGRRTLRDLHIENQTRIKKECKKLGINPDLGESMGGNLEGYFSLHVGNYRAIYRINRDKVFVVFVGHRKDVYDKFVG